MAKRRRNAEQIGLFGEEPEQAATKTTTKKAKGGRKSKTGFRLSCTEDCVMSIELPSGVKKRLMDEANAMEKARLAAVALAAKGTTNAEKKLKILYVAFLGVKESIEETDQKIREANEVFDKKAEELKEDLDGVTDEMIELTDELDLAGDQEKKVADWIETLTDVMTYIEEEVTEIEISGPDVSEFDVEDGDDTYDVGFEINTDPEDEVAQVKEDIKDFPASLKL